MPKAKRSRRAKVKTGKRKAVRRTSSPTRSKGFAAGLPETLFTVRPVDLAQLSPEGAVQFFQELAWAEARRAGLPTTQVHVSRWVDVPDGGVDASGNADVETEIFSKGNNGFQIKAGWTFQPWQKSHIKRALFEAKTPVRETLGESVRACLDCNGRYVLLCTGSDPNDLQRRAAVSHLREFFAQCGYKNAKVAVWGQNHLIGLLKRFPSLSLQLNGRGGSRFQSHASWSQQADMKKSFKGRTDAGKGHLDHHGRTPST